MSANQRALVLVLKGAITEQSDEDRAKINVAHEKIGAIVAEAGDAGKIALALAAAELAAEDD